MGNVTFFIDFLKHIFCKVDRRKILTSVSSHTQCIYKAKCVETHLAQMYLKNKSFQRQVQNNTISV